MLARLEAGDFGPFDEWLKQVEKGVVEQPFRFDDLYNGDGMDLKPKSAMSSKRKRQEKAQQPSKPDDSQQPPSSLVEHDGAAEETDDSEFVKLLKSFPRSQFFCKGKTPDFLVPGALDLFSGSFGVARQLVAAGAPWVLTFEWKRSSNENLLLPDLRDKLVRLIELGAFGSVSMAPVCASFSRAITPAVRSRAKPRGLSGLTANMRRKVKDGNSHADFCLMILDLCDKLKIAYFLENPDSSWMWRLRGFRRFSEADSQFLFL